jgi:predicted esterase
MAIDSYHIQVTKTARYFTLGTLNETTEEIWFVVHGFAQLAEDFLKSFEPLDNGRRFIVAPEALNKFYIKTGKPEVGATWMTREDREAEMKDYVVYLNKLYDELSVSGHQARIVVLGFSQGVATLSRWVYKNQRRMDTLIFYAGEIANELQNAESVAAFNNEKKYLICGDQDQFINELNLPKVKSLLASFEFVSFEGKHEIKAEVLEGLAL